MENIEPLGFNNAKKKAAKALSSKKKLKVILSDAIEKAINNKKKLKSVWDDFQTLLRLISAWLVKDYNKVPWKTILYSVAAIIYFINPIDIIPDFIPFTGLIDDISIIGFVIKSIKNDITLFLEWEEKQST